MLDVACGTGIVARDRGRPGRSRRPVTGIDLNENMLIVARRVRPDVTYQQGDVAALPFPDDSFDAVLCQMALMFFPDRTAALREMGRVAGSVGSVALCVPATLDEQPAEGPLMDVVTGYIGPQARALLGTYYSCGDSGRRRAARESAGLTGHRRPHGHRADVGRVGRRLSDGRSRELTVARPHRR